MVVECSLVVKYKRTFRDYQRIDRHLFAYDQMLGSHNQKCNQTTARWKNKVKCRAGGMKIVLTFLLTFQTNS